MDKLDQRIHPKSLLTFRDQSRLYRQEMGFDALLRQTVHIDKRSGYEANAEMRMRQLSYVQGKAEDASQASRRSRGRTSIRTGL